MILRYINQYQFGDLWEEKIIFLENMRLQGIRVYRISGKNLVYKWGTDKTPEQEDVIVI